MNKVLGFSFCCLLGLLLISCNEDRLQEKNANESVDKIGIEGTIAAKSGIIFMESAMNNRLEKVSSASVDSLGHFILPLKDVAKNRSYRITFPDKKTAFVYLDTDYMEVIEDDNEIHFKGSDESNYYNQYMKIAMRYGEQLSQLNTEYQHLYTTGNTEGIELLKDEFEKVQGARDESLKSYLLELPVSNVLVSSSTEYLKDSEKNKPFLEEVVAKLEASELEIKGKDQFISSFKSSMLTAVGSMAPDFQLTTPIGEKLSLSSLKGKYVMIDFWASWCGPCRKENPNVVRLYQEYKSDPFEILGVSLDGDQNRWVQAIQQDGLVWKHVSDLKKWNNEAAKLYNVQGIPATFLLNPEGEIIAKNLRGDALAAKLKEIFKH